MLKFCPCNTVIAHALVLVFCLSCVCPPHTSCLLLLFVRLFCSRGWGSLRDTLIHQTRPVLLLHFLALRNTSSSTAFSPRSRRVSRLALPLSSPLHPATQSAFAVQSCVELFLRFPPRLPRFFSCLSSIFSEKTRASGLPVPPSSLPLSLSLSRSRPLCVRTRHCRAQSPHSAVLGLSCLRREARHREVRATRRARLEDRSSSPWAAVLRR